MENENASGSDATSPADNESNTGKGTSDVRTKVAALILESQNGNVRDRVVTALAELEIKKRVDLILDGFDKLSKLQADVRKIRPDQKSVDADGKVISETYSAAKFEELKKAREQVDKLEKALNLALDKADYSKLKS